MSPLVDEKLSYKKRKFRRVTVGPRAFKILVESEPGDLTHYTYCVYNRGASLAEYEIRGDNFHYPKAIDLTDLADTYKDDTHLLSLAEKEDCNPHTVAEVIAACTQIKLDEVSRKVGY